MATYKRIQNYVKIHYFWTPKTCWIADVMSSYGLTHRKAWNRKGEERANPCPPNKRAAIEEALRHFGMIK
jgi:hypothetical protein